MNLPHTVFELYRDENLYLLLIEKFTVAWTS